MAGTQWNTTQCFMSFVVVDQEQDEEGTVGAFWFCLLLELGHRHCGKTRWKEAFQPIKCVMFSKDLKIDK